MCLTMLKAVIFICALLEIATSSNFVVWNKDKLDFVPISNISNDRSFILDILNSSRELETHNFQNEPLKLGVFYVSINEKNLKNRSQNLRLKTVKFFDQNFSILTL